MNKKNIYHSDIKDSNVVVKEDKNKLFARLIDWGLTTEYEPFKNKEFPSKWRNRPLQFNVPFSVIIFSDSFIEKYTKYIKEGGKINRENLKPFVIDFIHSWLKERGPGHYKFINDIMFMLFSNDFKNMDTNTKGEFIESNYTIPYITNYIVAILEKFTTFKNDGRINLRDYLDNVYINIIDVYGFICIYYPLIEFFYENYNKLNKNQMEMFNLIKYIFIKYLYSERTTPINIDELIKNLQHLGNLINSEKNINANGIKRVKKNKTLKINFKRNRKYMSRRLKKYLMLS
jgi:hypothetical protein